MQFEFISTPVATPLPAGPAPRGRPRQPLGGAVRKPRTKTRRDVPIPEPNGDLLVRIRPTVVRRLVAHPNHTLVLRAFPRGDGTYDILAGSAGATDFFIATETIMPKKAMAMAPVVPPIDIDVEEEVVMEEGDVMDATESATSPTATPPRGHSPPVWHGDDVIAAEAWANSGPVPLTPDSEAGDDDPIIDVGNRAALATASFFVLPPDDLDASCAPLEQTFFSRFLMR